jgi:hypothetical protein
MNNNDTINIIFIMEHQEPTSIKVSNQIKAQALLSMLKRNCVEKHNIHSFQTNEIVIMIPSSKPKQEFYASSAFQCAPEAHMLPMPDFDFFD